MCSAAVVVIGSVWFVPAVHARQPDDVPVRGETTSYPSANGGQEVCVRLDRIEGAHYRDGDLKKEKEYCAADFASAPVCPKLWSTSPGTVVYQLESTSAEAVAAFEKTQCSRGKRAKETADKVATMKVSVNGRETSGTYGPSSWVYYHLSRFLDVGIYVPPAVYRDTDREAHRQRVTARGIEILAGRRGAKMLKAGWAELARLQDEGSSREALTAGGHRVYGALVDGRGDRYGAEINGTRASGWGNGQNRDFQKTAPFLALRDQRALDAAIPAAITAARRDPAMAKALRADVSAVQVAFWMRDVAEIALLDFLLSQQDRIGNIDAIQRWYWVSDGKAHSHRSTSKTPPAKAEGKDAVHLRQSAINDNDAGVRRTYVNYAERTQMLEGLRHYPPKLYRRLGALQRDLQNGGDVHRWLGESAGLSAREVTAIVDQTAKAWNLLSAACQSGAMALDVAPERLLPGGESLVPSAPGGCELPP